MRTDQNVLTSQKCPHFASSKNKNTEIHTCTHAHTPCTIYLTVITLELLKLYKVNRELIGLTFKTLGLKHNYQQKQLSSPEVQFPNFFVEWNIWIRQNFWWAEGRRVEEVKTKRVEPTAAGQFTNHFFLTLRTHSWCFLHFWFLSPASSALWAMGASLLWPWVFSNCLTSAFSCQQTKNQVNAAPPWCHCHVF